MLNEVVTLGSPGSSTRWLIQWGGERKMALAIVRYVFGSYGVREDMAAVAAELLQLPDPHTGRGGRGGPGAGRAETPAA